MKLHFREMLEPLPASGNRSWNATSSHPTMHWVSALCRHLGLRQPDDDIHRLAMAISGLGVMLHICTDVTNAVRPALIASQTALDAYCDRLVDLRPWPSLLPKLRRAPQQARSPTEDPIRPIHKSRCSSPVPATTLQTKKRQHDDDPAILPQLAPLVAALALSACSSLMPPAHVDMVAPPQWHRPLPHQGTVGSMTQWWQNGRATRCWWS
ncbi:MAG: hypothetical protein IPO43_15355 [Rhodoferax sp.]|nr:hypothetical protein [Rhodoferax sp.]